MSGHSKWATIKHKKGALDAKRGALFTKLIKEITTAARTGGGSVETNPRLRLAIEKAKGANMPGDNVDRAVKKGTGELPGVTYEELMYEGYGPHGVALLIEILTDNKNRTASEIRNILEKKGGSLSGSGSVAWQFAKKGLIVVKKESLDEEKIMTIALDAGASDFNAEKEVYEIVTEPQDFEKVKKAVTDARITPESAEVTRIPSATVKVTGVNEARSIMVLMDALEDHEDVQNVYANFDMSDEILHELAK